MTDLSAPRQNYGEIRKRLHGLVILKNMLRDPAVRFLDGYFSAADLSDDISAANCFAGFVYVLFLDGTEDFAEHLYRFLMSDDNIFLKRYREGRAGPLEFQLMYELDFLTELADAVPPPKSAVYGVTFPPIGHSRINFRAEYMKALPVLTSPKKSGNTKRHSPQSPRRNKSQIKRRKKHRQPRR